MYFDIEGRKIGDKQKVFIVAELSANHLQSFNIAAKSIRAIKEAGADSVKFQTYTPDTMTIDVDNKYFRIKHKKWGGQTLYQLYKKTYTPWKWFKKLKKMADDMGILFFSTAFDKTSVDFLESLNVSMHKIASFELVDLPLIEYVSKTKKPLILSTGMANVSEIRNAVITAKNAGAKNIILLKCISSYPAEPHEMNLNTIPDMRKRFNFPVGLSDHTLGTIVPVVAVTLGACMIEKHFILSKKLKTTDSFFSIEPRELKILVDNIRLTECCLGNRYYGLTEQEKKSLIFRRSLFAVKYIKNGDLFTEDNIRSIRPSSGLTPKYLRFILGKKANCDIKKGTPLRWSYVKGLRHGAN